MSARRVEGGLFLDRSCVVSFSFEGRQLSGFKGDTLASALLANDIAVVGRSFKYHRPRGLLGAGVEEPNALMAIGRGAGLEPNLRATEVELEPGLVARAVNCWPTVNVDVGAINGVFSKFIPAGFYYKTFMWPNWHWFEPWIRKAAGLGRAPDQPDPDRYERRFGHCDVLVVGAGPAGLAAAKAAMEGGQRVILVEQDTRCGGTLLDGPPVIIDGRPEMDWVGEVVDSLSESRNAQVLTRTTALGYFDHNSLLLVERTRADSPHVPKQRLWSVRAKKVVLATGALERPLVFPGNDRPGVMLASAVSRYLARYGVMAGQTIAIFTNNDSAYSLALTLRKRKAAVSIIDSRTHPPDALVAETKQSGVTLYCSAEVVATFGRPELNEVAIRHYDGKVKRIAVDLLAMSGGWNPSVQLFAQSGGELAWDEANFCFRPGRSVQAETSIGAAAGTFTIGEAIAQGLGTCGRPPVTVVGAPATWTIESLWRVNAKGKAFVDFQNDVTAGDIELAQREAFVSVEHLKRYTTLGMAPDQGKTSNVNALAIMASLTGRSIPETGTTKFRFPFTPLALGALAGRSRGNLFRPCRYLPAHAEHTALGAVFEEYSGWYRPAYYLRPGEDEKRAEQREARAVRNSVGIFDSSPLGKIEVSGKDAATFLDRIYANRMSTLKVGRARYGLMLNELGVIIDDGIAVRLAEDRFLIGTTSGGADRISDWMEEWLQCEWSQLDVIVAPVTTSWAVVTLAGPRARDVLSSINDDFDLRVESFPHMSFREGHIGGFSARILRASFTGELSFEVSVPSDCGAALWQRLMNVGQAYEIMAVGIDAWMLLRTEKGYFHLGADTDGSTTPADVGWEQVLARSDDFIGRRSLIRPQNVRDDRHQFVGLKVTDSDTALEVGAHLRSIGGTTGSEGYVTSATFSPTLGRGVALGMVKKGSQRLGEELCVVTGSGKGRRVVVIKAGEFDPAGERLNG